tara:strand:- start:5172 stop:5804 length:633 start_codon:yes stop_codon:yes gene_type:complete
MDNTITILVGFLGIVVGSILTFVFQYFLKNRDLKLRIFEKVFERKWEAQNRLISCLNQFHREEEHELYLDKEGEAMFYASVLESKEAFLESLTDLRKTWEETRHLVEPEATSIYVFFEFYLDYLLEDLNNRDNHYNSIFVGHVLFDEISDLAEALTQAIWSDIKFQMNNPTKFTSKKHRWIDPKIDERMKQTQLFNLSELYYSEVPRQHG